MDSYELLYVVPTQKINHGKNVACLAFRKGNLEPQKQYQSAERYMTTWQEELEYETQRKAEVTFLYPTKSGGRGKVYRMPNGQIFIPIPILPGKGNSTGYVSVTDIMAICQDCDGNGMIRFGEKQIFLSTHMAVHSLYDRVNMAKSTYCQGYRTSDLILEMLSEKEKVQCALSQPQDLGSDILQLDKSMIVATLDRLQEVPPEDLARTVEDLSKQMKRLAPYQSDMKMAWIRAYVHTMFGHIATKEEVKKTIELAKHPESLPAEYSPDTKKRQIYWTGFSDNRKEASEGLARETSHKGVSYGGSYSVNKVRKIAVKPYINHWDTISSTSLLTLSDIEKVIQGEERLRNHMAQIYRNLYEFPAIQKSTFAKAVERMYVLSDLGTAVRPLRQINQLGSTTSSMAHIMSPHAFSIGKQWPLEMEEIKVERFLNQVRQKEITEES